MVMWIIHRFILGWMRMDMMDLSAQNINHDMLLRTVWDGFMQQHPDNIRLI
jgi:hypothetical protein